MNVFKTSPATLALIAINVIVFGVTYFQINTFDEPEWTLHLLKEGALFNPFALGKEWYRIFTHMFLHGGLLHIAFNMYALYSAGTEIESDEGSVRFLWIYFFSGIAAALVSLYWSLFTIGVGASGAIFGLFGFSLVMNLFRTRQSGESLTPIIVNFVIFLAVNLYFAKAFKADTAAHLGGLFCGIIIGILSTRANAWFWSAKIHYAFIPVFIAVYFALPRYQVTYYNFFQAVLAAEDSSQRMVGKSASDEEYLAAFKSNLAQWDSTLSMLNRHSYLPEELHRDTFNLRHYIQLRIKENAFRITMIERESYIYLDSVEIAQDSMRQFLKLDRSLSFRYKKEKEPLREEEPSSLMASKVFFNGEWEEVTEPPFAYYRIGLRDSLGRWQGALTDYYANGNVQMKGTYKDDEQNGIFIYYSDHKTYTSAGRYQKDRSIGKWETFHRNGKLQSEVYYNNGYFLKNLFDSTGHQLVKDGNGKVIEHYSNGVIANEGEYKNGNKEGYWYGRHENGDMYYEENYFEGRLTKGRSRNKSGETFVYDASSWFPIPEGGYAKLKEYLMHASGNSNADVSGVVRLSFRVTAKGNLTDFKVVRSISKITDALAKQIIKNGPRWIPAREHGDVKTDGFAFVDVEF